MTLTLSNTAQGAVYLGVNKAFLERVHWTGARIPLIKIGSLAFRYLESGLVD